MSDARFRTERLETREPSPCLLLEQKLSALQSKISQQHNTEISLEQFKETVSECINVMELTPFVLNKLISKIEIGSLETVDGEKQKEVSVEWKFTY